MSVPPRPQHRADLIPLYSQLVFRVDNLLKPLFDAPKALDFPQKRPSIEIAILSRLSRCPDSLTSLESHIDRITHALKRSNADLRSLLSHQSRDLVSQTVVPRESFRMNDKCAKIQRRISVIRSVIATLERENDQLNTSASVPSPPLLALRELVETEWLHVAELERALHELRKENAMILSREKGQIDASQHSVESITREVKLLEHRLAVLAKARAPAHPPIIPQNKVHLPVIPQNKVHLPIIPQNKVHLPIIPRNRARRRTPRQRIVFRQPKPPGKKRIPIVEPTPRFIPVRIAHLWSTDEEPEDKPESDMDSLISTGSVSDEPLFDENEISVDPITYDIESVRDPPVDQLEIHEPETDPPLQNGGMQVEQAFRRRSLSADQDKGMAILPRLEITENDPEITEKREEGESVRRWKVERQKRISQFDRVSGELVGMNGLPLSPIANDSEEDNGQISGDFVERTPRLSEENSEYSSTEDELPSTLIDPDDVSNEPKPRDNGNTPKQNRDLNQSPAIVGSIQKRGRRRFFAIETCIVTSQSPK